ncbi:uncharacterized protein Z520_03410 [Fonsecaea multimorphosa CBS 102226]|uniref:NmrA-like domain-containing protein n=1 Tax=Fonsecaea multimorphosa CBS 102226 TaxID=1442371 RepID=A0A0D2KCA3_9EURO|nr:uncharacterized protein Z520_03410 [Fonsecaea multimorphosa CBS 102226]KIY00745.1 hypothetical protein Z520_03410 [Fonsecaea multimorphosa CBS 102226]OAL27790.1 hypothetical protein AYO22_03332 [Fonsecaea multimorphosa]
MEDAAKSFPFSPSPTKPVVAVAGGTGDLDMRLTETFLSDELRPRLSGFVLLARRHTARTERWRDQLGAEVRIVEEDGGDECDENDLVMALDGVDVLINAISTSGARLRDKIASALPRTGVKLYFPSEFGVDHRLHDFRVPEWDGKKRHYEHTKKVVLGESSSSSSSDMRVCRIFNGLFLHSGIGPWYGFHTAKDVYQAVGSVDQVISYTDISDIARVLCRLAEMAMREGGSQNVPEELRIAGTHASFRQIARMMMTAAGAGDIELKSVDLDTFRERALQRQYEDRGPIVCLRFIMGDGRADYRPIDEGGLGNDNHVVNPDQKYFRWKTMNDLAIETRGRPNGHA